MYRINLKIHKLHGYTFLCAQLAAVFSTWIGSNAVGSLTSTQLSQLGYFVCGLTTTQVQQVSITAFL
jgi:hypothetical protein